MPNAEDQRTRFIALRFGVLDFTTLVRSRLTTQAQRARGPRAANPNERYSSASLQRFVRRLHGFTFSFWQFGHVLVTNITSAPQLGQRSSKGCRGDSPAW